MNRRALLAAIGGAGLSLPLGLGAAYRRGLIGPPRGDGDPVSIERTVESDGDIEYLEDSDRVRYATLMSGGEPVEYETESFERWAARRCVSVGSDAVLPAVGRRIDGPVEGVGKGVRDRIDGLVITVDYTTTRNRDGEVVGRPNLPFSRLVEATPSSVEAAVTLEDRTHERSAPVYVVRSETAYADGP